MLMMLFDVHKDIYAPINQQYVNDDDDNNEGYNRVLIKKCSRKCTEKCAGKCTARELHILANTKTKLQGHNCCQTYFEKCMRLVHMYLPCTLCMGPYTCMKECMKPIHLCMKPIHLCTIPIHLCTDMSKHYVSTLHIMSRHKIYLRHKCM